MTSSVKKIIKKLKGLGAAVIVCMLIMVVENIM